MTQIQRLTDIVKTRSDIINYDNGTASDVYELIKYVQSVVKEKYGVTLETEVKLIGEF